MANILIIGGLCGVITSWNSFLIGGSRAIFSMSESHMIPRRFSVLHSKKKTPINALLLIGVLSLIAPFFGKTMLVWISNASSFACCLAYCMVSISFIILRKKEPELKRPFRVKNYKVVGFVASLLSGFMVLLYLIPGSNCSLSKEEWFIVGGWTALGIDFYIVCKTHYNDSFGKVTG